MKATRITALLLSGFLCAAYGDTVYEAEQLLRKGEPLQALRVLSTSEPASAQSPEYAFWMGRILLELKRPREASVYLRTVSPQHALFPYAARGLLYCAQLCPELDMAAIAGELSQCKDEQVASLALACLVEQQLRYSSVSDLTDFDRLRAKAEQDPELQPLVKLLGIHALRHEGNFNEGIERARVLENDSTLSATMRQRVRLALAELYYDKEETNPQPENEIPGAEETEEDVGKGEETLLQFISANADSPLLEEAFRRLHAHGSIEKSEYTREKLQEWMEDTSHPHRAALAILAMMRLHHAQGRDTSSLANLAAAELPGEPATRAILQEHIRYLLAHGDVSQTLPYHALLNSLNGGEHDDARELFLKAQSTELGDSYAAETFLRSAETADESLRTPALVNALICAMNAGNSQLCEQLLNTPMEQRSRRAVLLAHAQLLPPSQRERALRELQEVLNLQASDEQRTDVMLTEMGLTMKDDPSAAIKKLLRCTKEERAKWTDEQELHYAALVELAADLLPDGEQADADSLLRRLYEEASTPARKEAIALHLADRLSLHGKHALARDILLELSLLQPPGEKKATSLLYAGRECERCGTLPSLQHASRLFADCVRQDSSLSAVATIERASVLSRINRMGEAFSLLAGLDVAHLPAEQQAAYYSVLVDSLSYSSEKDALTRAISACENIFSIPQLPHVWLTRARLQHAALCTRASRNDTALQDYLDVMNDENHAGGTASETCRFMYYYAGAGAVYRLLQMENYSEAADLAEKVSRWAAAAVPNQPSDKRREDAFMRWARVIRQIHYLPADLTAS